MERWRAWSKPQHTYMYVYMQWHVRTSGWMTSEVFWKSACTMRITAVCDSGTFSRASLNLAPSWLHAQRNPDNHENSGSDGQ